MGSPAVKAEAEEAATQVLYRFPSKVTLASGATMMIPFVDHEIPASRTYLYQPDINLHRPLAAIKLRNDGDSALPAGLVTAFETGAGGDVNFAGDAQLPLLPKGATRFVTFALDTKTAIRRSDMGVKQVRLGKAVRGELSVTVKSLWTVDYEITPPVEEDREVILEEPRQDGWKTAGDSKNNVEETPTRLRYTVLAPKGKTAKATLLREHMDYESMSLSSLAPDRIAAVISGLENDTRRSRRRPPSLVRSPATWPKLMRVGASSMPNAGRSPRTRIASARTLRAPVQAPISAATTSIRSRARKTGLPQSILRKRPSSRKLRAR